MEKYETSFREVEKENFELTVKINELFFNLAEKERFYKKEISKKIKNVKLDCNDNLNKLKEDLNLLRSEFDILDQKLKFNETEKKIY